MAYFGSRIKNDPVSLRYLFNPFTEADCLAYVLCAAFMVCLYGVTLLYSFKLLGMVAIILGNHNVCRVLQGGNHEYVPSRYGG